MNDLFSQFADQFKPKEEPQKEVKPEPIQEPIAVKEDRLVERYEAYRKSHSEYISVKDFELLEQRENAVESLETMSEFEKKQRRLVDKQKPLVDIDKMELVIDSLDKHGNILTERMEPIKELTAADKFLAGLKEPTVILDSEYFPIPQNFDLSISKDSPLYTGKGNYTSMFPGLKELQKLNGVNDHELTKEALKNSSRKNIVEGYIGMGSVFNKELEVEPLPEIKHYRLYGEFDAILPKAWCGVDPGKKGGIVAITDKGLVGKWTMPLLGDDIDAQGIWDILAELKSKYEITLVLEDVHSLFGMSAATNFSMGHTLGIILGIIVTSKIKLIRVAPKTWQKEIWDASDMEYKPMVEGKKKASVDTKLTSMKAAHRLFPNADFRATTRSKNDHDGITDAVCLSEYARRKNL